MQRNNVSFVVQLGLSILIIVLFLLGVVGMDQMRSLNINISNKVHNADEKVFYAHQMRDAIRKREIALNKMAVMTDPFLRDDEFMLFYQYGGDFLDARRKLLDIATDESEKEIQKKILAAARVAQPLNVQAAELFMEGTRGESALEVIRPASEAQQVLMKRLDELVELQYKYDNYAVHEGRQLFDDMLLYFFLIGIGMTVASLLVIAKMARYVTQKNNELVATNRELVEASATALTATKTKSAFLATMSHEIRTPLTAIIGFAEALLDCDQDMRERIVNTQTIIRSGRHLLQIINDILDLSKIEANKFDTECIEVALFELLKEVESIVRPQAQAKGLNFTLAYEFPIPEKIQSDPLRIKQILINLTNNAIKFTDSGHVIVRTAFSAGKHQMSFTVIDSGIGMSVEHLDKIFVPFTQADSSTSRKYGGTGLGLSLSRELAVRLGGDLSVRSMPGVGSHFTFTINTGNTDAYAKIRSSEEIPDPSSEKKSLSQIEKFRGRVLLAEDNSDNQRLLSHIVGKLGASIDIADNGRIAVEMAQANHYDLVLMDMQMPIMDGFAAIAKLRNQGYQQPIVALTANAMKKDRQDCIEAGCNDFLTKPLERAELYRVAAKFLPKDLDRPSAKAWITSSLLETEPDLADIVKKFVITLPTTYESIKQYTKDRDWTKLRGLIHQLKGTGGGMGFPVLTGVAGKIEFQLATQDYNAVCSLILELGVHIEAILGAYQDIPIAEVRPKVA